MDWSNPLMKLAPGAVLIGIFALAAISGGCTVDTATATRALEAQGITNVKIGSYAWLGCGKEDTFSSYFTGTGANGKPVKGVVCSGILKGVTVRFD